MLYTCQKHDILHLCHVQRESCVFYSPRTTITSRSFPCQESGIFNKKRKKKKKGRKKKKKGRKKKEKEERKKEKKRKKSPLHFLKSSVKYNMLVLNSTCIFICIYNYCY